MPHTETLNLSISVTHVTNETVDNSAQEPTQPAAAGAEGGAAAGTTLPLRGFAMVLIAVAVMFGLWALYAFTQDNGSEQAAEDTSQQAEQQAGDANAPEPGTVGADTAQQSAEAIAPENGEGAESAGDEGAESAENEGQPADAEREGEGREGASGSTGSGNAAAPAPLKINVLNNSVTQGLAADVSDRLRADGRELGEVGNFSDDVLPETTVFFPAGNADAERVARELADEFNGVARENIDTLPDNTRDGVTLVLTEN